MMCRLHVQTTQALLCVGEWYKKKIITDKDIIAFIKGGPEVVDDMEEELVGRWDGIAQ